MVPVEPAVPGKPAAARSAAVLLALLALLSASTVAASYLIGDITTPLVRVEGADYLVKPIKVGMTTGHLVGWGAVAVTLVLLAWAGVLIVRGHDPRWLVVAVAVVSIGALVAVAYRVVTAGVIGANIGGGGVILVGPPLILLLGYLVGRFVARLLASGRLSQ